MILKAISIALAASFLPALGPLRARPSSSRTPEGHR